MSTNELNEYPFITIISRLLDVFVPIYSIIVIYIIWNHHQNSLKKANQSNVYLLKKQMNDSNNIKKDWKTLMTGHFNQGEADGLDRWLVFIRKSYAARLVAPAVFYKLNNTYSFSDNIFDVSSDFGNSGIPSKAPNLKLEIATCEEEAKPITAKDKDGVLTEYRCWIKPGEEVIIISFSPVDKSTAYLKTWHTRRVLDPDLIELKWTGEWSDTGEKGEMTSYFRRIG